MIPGMELDDPAERERLLRAVDPSRVREHHQLLRDIFRVEMRHRNQPEDDGEFFENLYWCAFLLYLVGDPSDVPMMWQAKHLDFDTACGFDVQFLLGAGAELTLAHLTQHGHADVARGLAVYPELNEDLEGWESFRRNYFRETPRPS
jgi:hypothetical protein